MKKEKIKNIIISILIPIILGAIVSFIISFSMKSFDNLNKPPLNPPKILFPIFWTIFYILMGISHYLTKNDEESNKIYYKQLIVNLLWSIIFFTLKLRLLAFLWILLLICLIIKMIITFKKENKTAAYLQIPYLIWVIFATYLNLGLYILN